MVKETVLQAEASGKMLAQRLHTESLCCVVPCSDERYARLLRHMHILFGNFPGQENIHPKCYGLFEITLSAAAAPCDADDVGICMADDLRDT